MLAHGTASVQAFTRRDAVRLIAAAAAIIVGLSAILAIDIVPAQVDLQVGQVARQDVFSPRAIEYDSTVLTEQARQDARKSVDPQYDYTPANGAAIAAAQDRAFQETVAPIDAVFTPSFTAEQRKATLETAIPGLSDPVRATLVGLDATRWQAVRTEAGRVLDIVMGSEVKDTQVDGIRAGLVGLMDGDLTAAERELAAEIISPLVVANSSFSAERTTQKEDQAAAAVAPVQVILAKDQKIIGSGDVVTPLVAEEIQQLGLDQVKPDLVKLAGWIVLAVLIVTPFLAWIWRFRPRLWHRNNVLLLSALILLVTALALKLTAGRATLPFFLPTAAAGMLLAILLDAWAAMVMVSLIAILAGAVNGGSLELAAYVLLGGFAGIVTIRRGDRLQVFVQSGVAVAITNIAVVTAFTLLGNHDVTGMLQLWGASLVAAGGAAVATVGSFAVLGNLFGIVTVFQLLELANPSQALLRRLLVETPGTYHHSLMVGNLAERAAETIGADPLLARVTAYYHDIGKLANPLAFIENQSGGDNVHDELEPEVSAQILKQHVADGIDLAYRYGLPKTIIAFIPQHHGTALISYFYAKAREQAAAPYGGLDTPEGRKAADAVDKRRFQHAGPKPQSKEAAILMLADGVEASVRSLDSRDEAAIRAMVSRIIQERVAGGQFDECDLTLRDIERIREAFVSQLLGMYHQRIAYPQNKIVELESRRMAAGQGGGDTPRP